MSFVTIHDLSRELNIPARVVRYHFHQLRQAGKLIEGDDYRREDYVDEQHFTWLINPLSYMRETGKAVAPPPMGIPFPKIETPVSPAGYHDGNQTGNNSPRMVNHVDTKPNEFATQSPSHGNQPGTQSDSRLPSPSIEREMIEFLKVQIGEKDSQLHTKDQQIKGLSDQLKESSDLNVRLVGQNVHQANQIQDLLKLASGTPSTASTVADIVNRDADVVNEVVNNDDELDNNPVTSANADGYQNTNEPDEQGSGSAF